MTHSESERIVIGPLDIRPDQYLVIVDRHPLQLSQRELSLLTTLARRRGIVLSRDQLYELAWGRPKGASDRSVDVYVHKLRRKLERAVPDYRFIHTHHSIGYRFDPQPTAYDSDFPAPGDPWQTRLAGDGNGPPMPMWRPATAARTY